MLWLAALAVGYLVPLVGGMRGWRVQPAHFVERHGLILCRERLLARERRVLCRRRDRLDRRHGSRTRRARRGALKVSDGLGDRFPRVG